MSETQIELTENASVIDIKRYVLSFAGIYFFAVLATGFMFDLLGMEDSTSGSWIPLMIAGMATASMFVKREERVPTKPERKKLTWLFIASTYAVIPFLLLAIGLFYGETQELFGALVELINLLPLSVWLLIIAFVTLLHYFILWLCFSQFAKSQHKALLKQKEKLAKKNS